MSEPLRRLGHRPKHSEGTSMMLQPTHQVLAVWPILSPRPQQQTPAAFAVVAAAEGALAHGLRTVSPHSPLGQVSARPGFEDASPRLPTAPAVPHAARATAPRTRTRLNLKTRSRPSGPFCSCWSRDSQILEPTWDTPEPLCSPVGLACSCFGDRGNAPPGHILRPNVLPAPLDPFQQPRRALLSSPRAFLSHGLVGTWLDSTCPGFCSFTFSCGGLGRPKPAWPAGSLLTREP